MRKPRLLGQEALDLDLGVGSFFDAPVDLQHQAAAEDDAVVALLGAREPGLEIALAAEAGEGLRRLGDDGAEGAPQPPPARHGVQQRAREAVVGEAVVDQGPPVLPFDPGDGGAWALRQHPLRLVGARRRQRQHIGLGVPLGVEDVEHQQAAGALHERYPDRVPDVGAGYASGLAREPAPVADLERQQVRKLAPALRLEDRLPAPGRAGDRQAGAHRLLGPVQDGRRLGLEQEPVELVGAEGHEVGQLADRRELRVAEHLDRRHPLPLREVQLGGLDEAREVRDAEDGLVAVAAQEDKDLAVVRAQELERPAAEGLVLLAQGDQPPGPVQQRVRVLALGLDVDGLVVVLGIGDHRQVQALAVGAREAGVAVAAPLHRRAHAVAVAEEDVVAHPDLVAVVDDRRPGQREQEPVHELDPAPVVAQQRSQPVPDPEVDARLAVARVGPVHVVALFVGDHLQRQLVVVAQKQRPLRAVRYGGRLAQDVDDRETVLHPDGHEEPGHEREVERHVALVAVAEIGDRVFGPLVSLRQQHPAGVVLVEMRSQLAQEGVRLGQVLAVRPLAFVEVWHGVQAHAVHAHVEPELHDLDDGLVHARVVEVEVGLVGVEAVPVVGAGDVVPGPVRDLEVLEDDAGVLIALVGLAPDVEVAIGAARLGVARALEPRVLIGGVVADQLVDHAHAPAMCFLDEAVHVTELSEKRIHVGVVGDVVAVVAQR